MPGPPFVGTMAIRAMRTGDFQATIFDGTAAGLQDSLDYIGSLGGEVRLGPGTLSGITNLKIYGNTALRGSPFAPTILERSASATGPGLREYTFGEGNSRGATHIYLADFMFKGNGSTGNGIDLGNGLNGLGTDTFTLNANSGIHHVTVRDFVGDGFNLCSNTVHFSDIHGPSNTVGLRTRSGGGLSRWFGVWMEGNTSENMILESTYETFFGVHTEETVVGSQAAIKCTNGGHAFFGVDIYLTQNRTDLITQAVGTSAILLDNCTVRKSAAQTWNNTFRHLAYGSGIGAETHISLRDTKSGGGKMFFYDSASNNSTTITSATVAARTLTVATTADVTGATTLNSTLHTVGNVTFDGNLTTGTAGVGAGATIGQGTTGNDSATITARSGNGAGAVAQLLLNRNGSNEAGFRVAAAQTFIDTIGNLTFRNGISGPTYMAYGPGGAIIPPERTLTDAATIAVDASLGSYFKVTLGGNRTMGLPSSATTDQMLYFRIIQDGTGGRTLLWNAAFKHGWSDTGNTLNKVSTIAFKYDGSNWYQYGAQSPYV